MKKQCYSIILCCLIVMPLFFLISVDAKNVSHTDVQNIFFEEAAITNSIENKVNLDALTFRESAVNETFLSSIALKINSNNKRNIQIWLCVYIAVSFLVLSGKPYNFYLLCRIVITPIHNLIIIIHKMDGKKRSLAF